MKQKLLIFIVAYNASKTIQSVLGRIPHSLTDDYHTEVLIIDDASKDETFDLAAAPTQAEALPFPLHVLFNPVNQGYGGNQKIGFHYAIEEGFDFVALIHGDGQYAPECLPDLIKPLAAGEAEAVFGSRMLSRGGALKGGMPLYKFVGNHVLTWYQNTMMGASLSEYHSGYRLYATAALKRVPFALNSNVFHFDTEIILQFQLAGLRIVELPIPTFYGDEICHVDGLRYAWDVAVATTKARAQAMNLLYDRKFDCAAPGHGHYRGKLDFRSPHSLAVAAVPPGSRVLDLGCADGYVGAALRERGCHVVGVDRFAPAAELDGFVAHDLDDGLPDVDFAQFDAVLLLDVIEHLKDPEGFVAALRAAGQFKPDLRYVVSTGNVAFIITRLSLLLGGFNYGKRGILDLTHTRLFTFASMRRLFEQGGFVTLAVDGTPPPFPFAIGWNAASRLLLKIFSALICVRRSLFSFQSFYVFQARPTLPYLLKSARTASAARAETLGTKVK